MSVSGFWRRWMVSTAAIFGLMWLLLDVLDTGPRPGKLLLLVTFATAVAALVAVGLVTEGPDWSVYSAQSTTPVGQDHRLGMYTRVITGHLDARLPDPGLRDRFAALADRRLRQRHGVGLHDTEAADLLGEATHRILTGPARRLSRDEIERCVREIEELLVSTDARVAEASRLAGSVLDEVEKAVVGKRNALMLVLASVLAKGHVLLEDFPGLGKTLAARSLAKALGLDFARAQFTPDLLPADLTGSFIYDQRAGAFEFRRGPLFTGLLLADEINRTPPKTQSALLEAMQERQVTVEGETFGLPAPFHVLATANPIEYEGTYPLPEAQLDRFLMRVSFGYPTRDEEYDVLVRRLARGQEEVDLAQVTDAVGVLEMQAATETVTVDESVGRYCVDLAIATRDHTDVLTGSSPRGSLGLVLAARGWAVLRGRDYVIPEDVKAVARAVLGHRITVKPELWMTQASGQRVVDAVLASVATPTTLEATRPASFERPAATAGQG